VPFLSNALALVQLALLGHSKLVLEAISDRLYQDSISVGLRRDLSEKFDSPAAKIPIRVRPLCPQDDLPFLGVDAGSSDPEIITLFGQRRMLRTNLPTCYVALAPNGEVCYMQWLIPATENSRLRANFGQFPPLAPDEALLEAAFTVPAYRGQGVMASAMAQIAENAKQIGVRWVVTFVHENNVGSLKGCERAGFRPYVIRHISWRLLRRRIKFVPLSEQAKAGNLAFGA